MRRTFHLLTVFILSSATTVVSHVAHSTIRIQDCDYEIHTVEDVGIRYDSYFENSLEMQKTKGIFNGSTGLTNGTALDVKAQISNNQLRIEAKLSGGEQTLLRLAGEAKIERPNQTFRLSAKKPLMIHGSLYRQFEVRCRVGPETFSNRVSDFILDM